MIRLRPARPEDLPAIEAVYGRAARANAPAAAFLARHPDFTLTPASEVLARHGIVLDGELLRLLPHRHHTDGFFAAVLDRES